MKVKRYLGIICNANEDDLDKARIENASTRAGQTVVIKESDYDALLLLARRLRSALTRSNPVGYHVLLDDSKWLEE